MECQEVVKCIQEVVRKWSGIVNKCHLSYLLYTSLFVTILDDN
jgi:hypothetical protein